MISNSIKQVVLPGQIWNVAVDQGSDVLFLETRDENTKTVNLVRFDLMELNFAKKKTDHSWWTQLVAAEGGNTYFIKYLDKNDPNHQVFFTANWETGELKDLDTLPILDSTVISPHVYEHATDYHKTVASFLALDLPLSCEYLEWNDKIIISYYLRSGNEYDRHLLLIQNGEKKWKVCQDSRMKGFSPGAFFVFRDQLIFIKDRNEVCVYTD